MISDLLQVAFMGGKVKKAFTEAVQGTYRPASRLEREWEMAKMHREKAEAAELARLCSCVPGTVNITGDCKPSSVNVKTEDDGSVTYSFSY